MVNNEIQVFYEDDNEELYEYQKNAERKRVERTALNASYCQKVLVRERELNHLKRCIQMPNVSGFLDENQVRLYHQYGLLSNHELNTFLECKQILRDND